MRKIINRKFRQFRPMFAPTECYFCQKGFKAIDYKDTILLKRFLSAQAKILSPKKTGTCKKHQRQLARAIKRARFLALLPFTNR